MENKNENSRMLFRCNIEQLLLNKPQIIQTKFKEKIEKVLEYSKEETLDKIQLAIILMTLEMEYERK